MQKKNYQTLFALSILVSIFTVIVGIDKISAQNNKHYTRIARIVVDSSQLENYTSALKEGMKAAFQKEKGVLDFNAVYDKKNPTNITIFETYADTNAYKFHIQTAHFKKYKAIVSGMVKSLELTDVQPILIESKQK